MPRRWRIYYDGGTADWRQAVETIPGEGVIAIVQADDTPGDPYAVGRQVLFDRDFYWWEGDGWVMGDAYGLFDYLRRPGWKKIVAGRTVDRRRYKATLTQAVTDPDFPVKTARQAGEARLPE